MLTPQAADDDAMLLLELFYHGQRTGCAANDHILHAAQLFPCFTAVGQQGSTYSGNCCCDGDLELIDQLVQAFSIEFWPCKKGLARLIAVCIPFAKIPLSVQACAGHLANSQWEFSLKG